MLERSPLCFPRSSSSNHSQAFIACANRCMMKTWWSGPGKKGLRTPGTGHSSLRRCSHSGPSPWAIKVWGINVSSRGGVHPSCHPHSGVLQPRRRWLPEPHLIPRHKYNYTVSASLHWTDPKDVLISQPAGLLTGCLRKDEWRRHEHLKCSVTANVCVRWFKCLFINQMCSLEWMLLHNINYRKVDIVAVFFHLMLHL